MKKRLFCALMVAAIGFAACEKTNDSGSGIVTVELSADEAFDATGTAILTFTLSEAKSTNSTVTLSVSGDVQDGKEAISADDLTFRSNPVTLLMGKTTVSTTVTVNKANLKTNSQAVISIDGAEGVKVKAGADKVYINWNGPAGGGETTDPSSDVPSTDGWKITYDGTQERTDGGYTETVEVLTVSGTKGDSYYVFVADAGLFSEIGGDVNALLEMAGSYFEEDVEYYADEYGWTAEDLIYTDDPGEIWYDIFDEGDYEAYAIGMDTNGNASGKWAMVSFHAEGGPQREIEVTGPVTKISSWTANYIGRYEYQYIDYETLENASMNFDRVEVIGTGDSYFNFILDTKGFFDSYTLEAVLITIANDAWDNYDYYGWYYGYETITDALCDSEFNYGDFEAVDNGDYDVFIAEIGTDGNPTGRYNISTITIDGRTFVPDDDEEEDYYYVRRRTNVKVPKEAHGNLDDHKLVMRKVHK